jgi:hypothetical protein
VFTVVATQSPESPRMVETSPRITLTRAAPGVGAAATPATSDVGSSCASTLTGAAHKPSKMVPSVAIRYRLFMAHLRASSTTNNSS